MYYVLLLGKELGLCYYLLYVIILVHYRNRKFEINGLRSFRVLRVFYQIEFF